MPTRAAPALAREVRTRVAVRSLDAFFTEVHAIKNVSLAFEDRSVTAIIGPSGCGKSTFLRCLNRMHETIPGARVSGSVELDGTDIYAKRSNPIRVRQHIGMVFQRPSPFPTMSVRDNVAAGLRILSKRPARKETDAIVERALRRAALWDEVADRLDSSALGLSGGQQQRLCIARALATEPGVLLLDEPTASLDAETERRLLATIHPRDRVRTTIVVAHRLSTIRAADVIFVLDQGRIVEFGRHLDLLAQRGLYYRLNQRAFGDS